MAELRRLAQQTQRLVDIAHRQIRDADQALAVGAAEIPEPAVVSLEARDVELAVGGAERTAAEHHRRVDRSEEHTSELQSLMRRSYAVFCLKKKKTTNIQA